MQKNGIEETGNGIISIRDAARETDVSVATVRNWIRTGYLLQAGRGCITKASLRNLKAEVIGREKLISRANKQQKDQHSHEELTLFVNTRLCGDATNSESLGEEYEAALSESYRNKEGVYYTPVEIVKDLLSTVSACTEEDLFLDPCCGCGNFVMEALERGFKPQNIRAFDTDENAVAITRKRIFDCTGYLSKYIVQGDFLELASGLEERFECIFTNPPWGKKLPRSVRKDYAARYAVNGSMDTSSLFFFACLPLLTEGGRLGFLLPEAFFNITAYQGARDAALCYSILHLIDYGKPFKKLVTRAQGIILQNALQVEKQKEVRTVNCCWEGKAILRSMNSFRGMPKSIFNFWLSEEEAAVIHHVLTLPHDTLNGNAHWGLGIVTGNNRKYCIQRMRKGYIPVFRGSDIFCGQLKKVSNYIPSTLNLYQQVAPEWMYRAPEKLIYRFISSNLCFYCDTEQQYILNSANMLVLKQDFPLSGLQVADLMNSTFMNWLFKKVFRTHKVLRGDLEMLPIHVGYFKSNPVFNEESYLACLQVTKTNEGYQMSTM